MASPGSHPGQDTSAFRSEGESMNDSEDSDSVASADARSWSVVCNAAHIVELDDILEARTDASALLEIREL